jgi:hypothetical protein
VRANGIDKQTPPARRRGSGQPGSKNEAQASAVRDNAATHGPEHGNGQADETVAKAVHQLVHGRETTPQGRSANESDAPTMDDLRRAFGDKPQTTSFEPPVVYEVREPRRNGEFFRTHPNRELWLENLMLVDQEDYEKGVYPVGVGMVEPLREFLKRCLLVPCITKKGTVFIWPISIADLTLKQRQNKVEQNKRKIAFEATTEWRTLVWTGGQHVGLPADDGGEYLGDPKWPADLTVDLILERAFLPRLIASKSHDIAKIYLGLSER